MTKTIISTEKAIEEILSICENGGVVTIATNLKGFNWFVEGRKEKLSTIPYIAPNAILFEKDLPDEENICIKLIFEFGLTMEVSGIHGLYYLHK